MSCSTTAPAALPGRGFRRLPQVRQGLRHCRASITSVTSRAWGSVTFQQGFSNQCAAALFEGGKLL